MTEENEKKMMSPYACLSSESQGRFEPMMEDGIRIVSAVEGGPAEKAGVQSGDYLVEVDYPIPEIADAVPNEKDRAIGKLIADMIRDGDCLQLGIGGMPNAVGSLIAESDLRDLGVHTEMYVDAFVEIAKAGKINGVCLQDIVSVTWS